MSEEYNGRLQSINDYKVYKIPPKVAKDYITKYHYTHGCSNIPHPCYGLFDKQYNLIGVLMFATPCSEDVRASLFGAEHKDWVTELSRLHIKDVTPKNTESWFISKCLNLLKQDEPNIKAVISFSDKTENHDGTIYRATNFYYVGQTSSKMFYMDKTGRLRHPRQSGVDITPEMAEFYGWKPVKRLSKNRYIIFLPTSKTEKKKLIKMCHYDVLNHSWCRNCGKEINKPNVQLCESCSGK